MAKIKNNSKILVISGIILAFIALSFIYFSPIIKGEQLVAHDSKTFMGMSKEVVDFREAYKEDPKWTNSMFGGMPAYLISVSNTGELITKFRVFCNNLLPAPANLIALNFILFFILCLIFKVSPWLSMAGALMYGFSTYFFILIGAGHITKVQTFSYAALVVAGVILTYRGKLYKGGIIAALGIIWMLGGNHPQMTYYVGIMIIIIAITYLVYALKEKTIPAYVKSSLILFIALVLAIGTMFGRLYTTYEYGKYSTRGKSELVTNSDNQTAGLDRSYILDYSYDFGETVTAFIPRFKGGGMSEPLGEDSHFFKEIEKYKGKAGARQIAKQVPLYWGSQPISSAPFYFGAVLCFLFVFGLFIVKGKEKWWIAATVVVAFLLSLGKYLPALSNFMIDYFPGYNKFRDVKNIIVIQQFAMALLGVLAIKEVVNKTVDNKTFLKNLKWTFGITGGFALLFALIPSLAGDFVGKSDAQLGWPEGLMDALLADRKSVLRADAFRSFIFVARTAAGLWAFWTNKLKAKYALALWVVLVLADMWPINKKYMNNDNFEPKRKAEVPYTATKADLAILQDKTPSYRVLNISVSTFNDASTSYFHKSIGGYHGAKLERYQEMIQYHISPEIQQLGRRLNNLKSQYDLHSVFKGLNTLNMLNAKYIIYNPQAAPLLNTEALGNAWFVHDYKLVENANEEIEAINKVDISNTAIVHKEFEDILAGKEIVPDSTALISLESYAPNRLVYKTSCKSEQLAVFSEVYYPKGWYVYIDGKESQYFRCNYILRSALIPAGEHEVIFEFNPKSFEIGNKISFASSILMILAIAGVIFHEIRSRKKQQ